MVSAAEIRRRGWRQCSIASDSLRERLEGDELLADTNAEDILIIASQDCDLVHPSFAAEPYVELLVGKPIAEADGNCLRGKNPRRLHIDVRTSNGLAPFEILAVSRFSIARHTLSEHDPDPHRSLDDIARAVIPQWLAKRYVRAALPDAFNTRASTVQSKIRDRLKSDGELVEAIFLTDVSRSIEWDVYDDLSFQET